jgi:hypothetical protein
MANEQKMIPFTELATADLFVDAVYESAGSKIADDPLPRLLQVSNMGGFRYRGALVCIENLIRFDCVAESHNVSANGRADILLAQRGCLALQVEEPA